MAIKTFNGVGYKVWFDPERPADGFDLVRPEPGIPNLNLGEVETLRLAAWIGIMFALAKDPDLIMVDRSGGGG